MLLMNEELGNNVNQKYSCEHKPNMSHYHPVIFGINSSRRRSKKSKEITLFQSTKASQMYLIFQILFSLNKDLEPWI